MNGINCIFNEILKIIMSFVGKKNLNQVNEKI